MWALPILFAILIVYKIKITPSAYSLQPLNLNNTLALRGICSVEIMLGHLGITTGSIWLFPFRKAGILIVGVFFLISGYGLMSGLIKKNNYLYRFLPRRLSAILIPAYIVYILRLIFIIITDHSSIDITYIFQYFMLAEFLSSTNWYVFEIVAFYILFYLLFKYFDTKKAFFILSFLSVIFVVIAFILNLDNPWYGSTLCFPLGIFIKQNEKRFISILSRKYLLTIALCSIVLAISIILFFFNEKSIIGNLIGRTVASVTFCILVYLILLKVRIGNVFSNMLGTISYEIFLIHFVVLGIICYFNKYIIYSAAVICLTIILSRIVSLLNSAIKFKLPQTQSTHNNPSVN